MAERCQAITKSGKPCHATVVADGMCAWHAPSWDARRRQWSAEGGRKRSNRARAKKQLPGEILTDEEILAYLSVVLKAVIIGKMTPGVGNSAALISKAIVAVKQASALEERLAALEAKVGLDGLRSA